MDVLLFHLADCVFQQLHGFRVHKTFDELREIIQFIRKIERKFQNYEGEELRLTKDFPASEDNPGVILQSFTNVLTAAIQEFHHEIGKNFSEFHKFLGIPPPCLKGIVSLSSNWYYHHHIKYKMVFDGFWTMVAPIKPFNEGLFSITSKLVEIFKPKRKKEAKENYMSKRHSLPYSRNSKILAFWSLTNYKITLKHTHYSLRLDTGSLQNTVKLFLYFLDGLLGSFLRTSDRFSSFSAIRKKNLCKMYIDGEDYFNDLYEALIGSQKSVFITDW